MTVTRELVAQKMTEYLSRHLSLAELLGWAEEAMREGDFEDLRLDLAKLAHSSRLCHTPGHDHPTSPGI